MTILKRILFVSMLCVGTKSCYADFSPLASHKNTSLYYHSVRCMSLFGAMIDWSGKDRLGDMYPPLYSNVTTLGMAAIKFAMDVEGVPNLKNAQEILGDDFKGIMKVYIERMRDNYSKDGFSYLEDELIKSDLIYCKGITDEVRRVLE